MAEEFKESRKDHAGEGDGRDAEPTRAEAEQRASEAEQRASDVEQRASEAEQRASDVEQAMSDRDQRASDRDQAAADAELGEHPGPQQRRRYEESRVARFLGSQQRFATSMLRSRASLERDRSADRRDKAAAERDRASDERDAQAETMDRKAREAADAAGDNAGSLTAALNEASMARELAAGDRRSAARDRSLAALDRRKAARDRRQANAEIESAHLDDLTGAYRRAAGEELLRHELERAKRGGTPLVFAFIDVDDLKATNDARGHAAGDALLRGIVAAIASHIRPYDLLVRFGGDEFVCSLSDTDLAGARERFDGIQRALEDGSITVGLAEMAEEDTVESMTERGDAEMRRLRSERVQGAPTD